MARSQLARCRGPRTAAGPAARLARAAAAMAAGLTAVLIPVVAGPASAASAMPRQATGQPVSLSITGISPGYAAPGRAIAISVRIRNDSGAVLSGLSVRLLTSKAPFTSRTELDSFAQGAPAQLLTSLRLAPVTIAGLGPGAADVRSLRVPVSALGLNCFGVYPLVVQVSGATGPLASDQAAVPFWPGRLHTCPAQRPKPDDVAWIWPLIDRPHQGPCPGLFDNSLAASIEPGGRLGVLLAAGQKYAGGAQLTWVIDPALLDDVRTMRDLYPVGSGVNCDGGRTLAGSATARAWLGTLIKSTANRPVIATPYADVDIAALTQHLRNLDASRAFAEGQHVAGMILNRKFAPGKPLHPGRRLTAAAWPADGIANYALLENLASFRIGTVILDSAVMPPVVPAGYTPSGVTSTPDGVGTQMRVMLADDALTRLLGSRDARSRSAAAIFRVRQTFLAQTAMIVAERPHLRRPIVIAPPRHWNPAGRLASGLLSDTVRAPWLRPSTVGQLLTLPPDRLPRAQPHSVSASELPKRLLRRVAKLDRKVALLESVHVPGQPNLLLYRAAFGTESSAWRGGRGADRRALALLSRTSRYITGQWKQLSVGGFSNVTLGGTVSTVRMHVSNRLDYPVQVKLVVTASNQSVKASVLGTTGGVITIPAHVTSTVKLAVTASTGGAAKIRLSLHSPTGRPLPVRPLVMHIRATQFGTVALAICAAALAVFVIASAARAIRMGRPGPPEPGGSGAEPPDAGPADRPDGAEKPDTVESDDQPELMPAGPALADQEPPVPGSHPEGR